MRYNYHIKQKIVRQLLEYRYKVIGIKHEQAAALKGHNESGKAGLELWEM